MNTIPKDLDFDKIQTELKAAELEAAGWSRIVREAQKVVDEKTPLMREAIKKRDAAREREKLAHHVRIGKCAALRRGRQRLVRTRRALP